jgi:hypothetical protein
MRAFSSVVLAASVSVCSCGGSEDGIVGNAPDDSGSDAVSWPPPDASTSDAVADASVPPTPRAPCDQGSCWSNAPALSGACGTASVDETFASGLYNAHRYPVSAPGGVSLEITLAVTGGSWSPALLVHAIDGTTLYDGEHPLAGAPVKIEALASGHGTAAASLRVTAQADTSLYLFVTSWEVIGAGFAPLMPTDASYTLSTFADCQPSGATCPLHPTDITEFDSGYFTASDSMDPSSPNYNPYKRDTRPEHLGYDLEVPVGKQVLATQSGTIVGAVTEDLDLCGLSINLAADSGVTFRYCHLSSVLVTSGHVDVGQVIGLSGMTGNAVYPHLHFTYLDAPNVTGNGTDAQKSPKVNQYVDSLCQ